MNVKERNIITHDGVFHTDEVFSVAMLKLLLSNFKMNVIRTRSPKLVELHKRNKKSFLIDLGLEFNENNKNFDHHQDDYTGLKSSFGLIVESYKNCIMQKYKLEERFFQLFTKNLVEPIDNWDNNLNQIIHKAKKINIYSLQNVIASYNTENIFSNEQNNAFDQVVSLAQHIIHKEIKRLTDLIEEEKSILSYMDEGIIQINQRKAISNKYFTSHKQWAQQHQIKYMLVPVPNAEKKNTFHVFTTDDKIILPKTPNSLFRHKNGHFVIFKTLVTARKYLKML